MINNLAAIAAIISKHSVILAEVALWGFVAVGVFKVALNGINGLSSLLLGASLGLMAVAILFYLVSASCKMLVIKRKRERIHAINRR